MTRTDNDEEMARGALDSIHALLDDGGIPRGTFADDHVRNLVALYNQRGDEIKKLNDVLDHPRFVGLWTYRPYGGARKFCASVLVDDQIQETEIYDLWNEAVNGARHILEKTNR